MTSASPFSLTITLCLPLFLSYQAPICAFLWGALSLLELHPPSERAVFWGGSLLAPGGKDTAVHATAAGPSERAEPWEGKSE